jgi:DNA primase
VEGFFDCFKVHQAGVGSVVALMGCTMSTTQERLLAAHFRHVVLFLDGDDAGRSASSEIAARLAHHLFVRVVDTPFGVQADEMPPEQVRALLKPVMGWVSGSDAR